LLVYLFTGWSILFSDYLDNDVFDMPNKSWSSFWKQHILTNTLNYGAPTGTLPCLEIAAILRYTGSTYVLFSESRRFVEQN